MVFRLDGQKHVLAVLGPTNTGKTHFAVERMLAHKTGLIGFPLRLLANRGRRARMRRPQGKVPGPKTSPGTNVQ